MPIKFNHIHIKALDPEKTADWYGRAFGLKVTERVTRPAGDLFLNCVMLDGTNVIISGQKTGEQLPAGSSKPRLGLEHFAIDTDDFDRDLAHLKSLGAAVLDGPVATPAGIRIAFIEGPDDVRIELMWFPPK